MGIFAFSSRAASQGRLRHKDRQRGPELQDSQKRLPLRPRTRRPSGSAERSATQQ